MELNHEYQNSYIRGIISAINRSIDAGGISSFEFENIVFHKAGDPEHKIGLDFLYDFLDSGFFEVKQNNKYIPKLPVKISLLPTGAELQWLLHVLQLPMAPLFLNESERQMLIDKLNAAGIPDLMCYIRQYGFAEPELPDAEVFRTILSAIREKRFLSMTNHAQNGTVYRDQMVIPMKLEYNAVTGKWFLSFCPADRSRPIKAYLGALSGLRIGKHIPEIERPDLQKMMKEKRAEPLILRVYPEKNAPARAIPFFSQYDTTVLREPDGGLRMQIQYYVFDEETLLRQIIAFGPCMQILSPAPMVDKMREFLITLPY